MNLMKSTLVAAMLFTTPAFATNYDKPKPPVEPEPPVVTDTSSSDNTDIAAILVGIVMVAIIADALTDKVDNPPCITDQTYVGGKGEVMTLETSVCQ